MYKKLALLLSVLLLPVLAKMTITDVSKTSKTTIAALEKPTCLAELQRIVRSASKPISIAGGRFSQGGHIANTDGIVIDMTDFNRILSCDKETITVQTGITWRAIQEYSAPLNRAVTVMQSYNDFTVGGSLSVNVHGRDIHFGPLIETVQSIRVLLADGSIVSASRSENPDLFAGAIGGYGALGIIVEATLLLTKNSKIARVMKVIPIEDYPAYFRKKVVANPRAVFHNGNLYPNECTYVGSITWYETNQPLTIVDELQDAKKFYPAHMIAEQILRRIAFLKKLRQPLDERLMKDKLVVKRNYEMSSTVNTLEPLVRFPTTSVLQEYFVPVDKLVPFVYRIRTLIKEYGINVLNISIRYVPKNTESVLSYAQSESFALVWYINILNTKTGLVDAQAFTRALIDTALQLGGTYYLPYQLFGTQKQLRRSYPRWDEFVALKKKYDPQSRFTNKFLDRYVK